MEIDKKLYEEIKSYCELNGLKPKEYINSTLKRAFMEDKYGDRPFGKKIEVTSVVLKANDVSANGIVIPEAVLEDAVVRFNEQHPVPDVILTHNEIIDSVPKDENGNIIGTDMHDDGSLKGPLGEPGRTDAEIKTRKRTITPKR